MLEAIRARLYRAVEDGVTPGLVFWLVDRDGGSRSIVVGRTSYAGEPVSSDTRYDLASLTKVVATLPSVIRLVAESELRLEDTMAHFFSNIAAPSLRQITVRHLLTHTSGLRAWRPIYRSARSREEAFGMLLAEVPSMAGELTYSDLGFMLLGAVIEKISHQRLDAFCTDEVFGPLGMRQTGFGPLKGVAVAQTEFRTAKNTVLEGQVHDENASALDGVAGHAGLFSTGPDLAIYAQAWLSRDPRLGPAPLLAESVRAQASDGVHHRGLGWLLSHPGWFAGGYERGFGHTGFTGTSLLIDDSTAIGVALLTNRVHPHRGKSRGIRQLRSDIHTALFESLGDGRPGIE